MSKESIIFHPMSMAPKRDQNDPSFSLTVLVYSEEFDSIELGYFDFEDNCWYHFGTDSFLLKCWCYIPNPTEFIQKLKEWPLVSHQGYREPIYARRLNKSNIKKNSYFE